VTPVFIVELTGCSGAGKSTLLQAVLDLCQARGIPATTAPDLLLRRLPGAVVSQPTLQNLALDVSAMCQAPRARSRYRPFLGFARAVIRREADWVVTALNAYRAVLRTVGIHKALMRRSGLTGIVLVDEGIVHSAHNVLVHVSKPPLVSDIWHFAQLVPRPDLIVHVTAPLEVVLARSQTRTTRPLRFRSWEDTERFVRNAHAMFDRLMAHQALASNTVRIHSDGNGLEHYGIHAAAVVDRILQATTDARSAARAH